MRLQVSVVLSYLKGLLQFFRHGTEKYQMLLTWIPEFFMSLLSVLVKAIDASGALYSALYNNAV